VPVGQPVYAVTTIVNGGTTTQRIARVSAPGTPFAVQALPRLGTVLRPGQSVTVQVGYTPADKNEVAFPAYCRIEGVIAGRAGVDGKAYGLTVHAGAAGRLERPLPGARLCRPPGVPDRPGLAGHRRTRTPLRRPRGCSGGAIRHEARPVGGACQDLPRASPALVPGYAVLLVKDDSSLRWRTLKWLKVKQPKYREGERGCGTGEIIEAAFTWGGVHPSYSESSEPTRSSSGHGRDRPWAHACRRA